jgi:tetratricopeptide (TPR) repeat protein
LLRWRVDQLIAQERPADAKPLIRDSLELVGGRRDQLQATMDWLIDREAWEEIDQLARRFDDVVNGSLLLRYRVAESYLRRGDQSAAESMAADALKSKPEEVEEHIEAAVALQEQGLFPWAESEFRFAMNAAGPGSPHSFRARFELSEMLHDMADDLRAAQVLQELIDSIERDPEFAKRARPALRAYRNDLEEVRARMHFFYSEHYKHVDRAQQKQHLLAGINAYQREIDVIIAMYRFPDADSEWRQLTRQRLNDTVGYYREQIQDLVQAQNLQPAEEGRIRQYLAMYYNQLAWLIANTEGDLDEALRYSQTSLEYVPNMASYLDTLGRCYYAKKDYKNAVHYQGRAAALEPHSGQIQRQLELFQKALAEQPADATEK